MSNAIHLTTAAATTLLPQSTLGPVPRQETGSGPGGVRDSVRVSSEGRGLFESRPEESETGKTEGPDELSQEEKREVEELKSRDREVRAHEQAHVSALGGEGGSASFTYTTGPDGRQYATGGEVPISISEVSGNPSATIQRARKIASAALAPSQPSGADVKAAAQARELEAKARRDLSEQKKAEASGEDGESAEAPGAAAPVEAGAAAAGDLISAAGSALGSGDGSDHVHAPGEHCAVCGV